MIVLQTIAVAFAMFSAVPVPQFAWNEKNMRYALCAFPLVGLLCGVLWCVCGVLLALGGGALAAVAILLFLWYHHVAVQQLGGITGDLAGWFLQKTELWMLAALCACQWGGLL